VSGDLYGDEALFVRLLHAAMETQPCTKCGYEVGREEIGSAEEGVIAFESPRWRKICWNCRQDAENAREERRERAKERKKQRVKTAAARLPRDEHRYRVPKKVVPTKEAPWEERYTLTVIAVGKPPAEEKKPGLTWDQLYTMIGMKP
jgi:hypothetical protein